MRAGKLLLTAGFLFGLTVAANGAEGTSLLKLEIVAPLAVTVNGGAEQNLGSILAGGVVNETAEVKVTAGGNSRTVKLLVDKVTLTNQAEGATDTIIFTPILADSSFSFDGIASDQTTNLNYDIASTDTDGKSSGLYEGTVTVTAEYN